MDTPATPNQTLEQKITQVLQGKPVILQLLRFAAIGFLNTGLNFLILNAISKKLGIDKGFALGIVSGVSFTLATIQSYYWNKYWAFGGAEAVSVLKNFVRLILVGALGVLAVLFALIGSKVMAPAFFYGLLLIVFFIVEYVLWRIFGFQTAHSVEQKNPFVLFVVVSLIGLLINVAIVSVVSSHFILTPNNLDLNKNIATIIATCVSLVWNFIGYKLIVFKR